MVRLALGVLRGAGKWNKLLLPGCTGHCWDNAHRNSKHTEGAKKQVPSPSLAIESPSSAPIGGAQQGTSWKGER